MDTQCVDTNYLDLSIVTYFIQITTKENDIGDEGVEALSEALRKNMALDLINLNSAPLTKSV